MKKYIYPISFSLVLAAFTLFVLLDTFVISQPMENVQGQINNSMFSSSQTKSEENLKTYKSSDSDKINSGVNRKNADLYTNIANTGAIKHKVT